MSRKSRYIPMDKRIVMLADLVELNDTGSLNSIDIARFNALEEALAIMESREPILKDIPEKKGISQLLNKWILKQPVQSEVH